MFIGQQHGKFVHERDRERGWGGVRRGLRWAGGYALCRTYKSLSGTHRCKDDARHHWPAIQPFSKHSHCTRTHSKHTGDRRKHTISTRPFEPKLNTYLHYHFHKCFCLRSLLSYSPELKFIRCVAMPHRNIIAFSCLAKCAHQTRIYETMRLPTSHQHTHTHRENGWIDQNLQKISNPIQQSCPESNDQICFILSKYRIWHLLLNVHSSLFTGH